MLTKTDYDDAMASLGVHDGLLTTAEREDLDRDGFIIMRNLIDLPWIEALRARIEELIQIETADDVHKGNFNSPFHREPGCVRLGDLVNKGEVFDRLWQHPKILAAARHVFARPFKLSSLNFRESLKGNGHQGLHADWGDGRDGRGHVLNSIWLLDDMNKQNGATRVVPGSHKKTHTELQAYWDTKAPTHPNEMQVEEPAGTVIIYNALAWHGGGHNHSGARRRAMHSYFTAREHAQQMNQAEYLRERTAKRLSPAARWLLDV